MGKYLLERYNKKIHEEYGMRNFLIYLIITGISIAGQVNPVIDNYSLEEQGTSSNNSQNSKNSEPNKRTMKKASGKFIKGQKYLTKGDN